MNCRIFFAASQFNAGDEMKKKKEQAFFKVFSLKDKTVFLALPTRKPHPKSLGGEKIDDEGIWCWYIEGEEELNGYKAEVKHLVYSTIANNLNVKRAIRKQVEPRLIALTKQVSSLKDQLDRIERKIDLLSRTADDRTKA